MKTRKPARRTSQSKRRSFFSNWFESGNDRGSLNRKLRVESLEERRLLASDLDEAYGIYARSESESDGESRIVINDGVGAAGAIALGTPHFPVVRLSVGCTGTLVDMFTVVTAQHCTFGQAAGSVTVNFHHLNNDGTADATRAVTAIVEADGTNTLLDGTDFSILRLTTAAPAGVNAMRLAAANPAIGSQIRTVGFGFNGVGSVGHGGDADGLRWAGDNILDAIGAGFNPGGVAIGGTANIFNTDFDDGTAGANTLSPGVASSTTPVTNEATTAPGDSGGPLIVNNEVAAVLSGGTTATSVYGDISWWTGTVNFQALILANSRAVVIGNTVALPEDGNANILRIALDAGGSNIEFFLDADGPGPGGETLVNRVPRAEFGAGLNITGSTQDDTLIVDFANGNVVPGPINYDGNGGFNTLVSRNGIFASGTSTPSSATDGAIAYTGGTTGGASINYLDLSPVTDTNVAATFTVFGSAGVDNITVAANGAFTRVSSTPATFELHDLSNKTQIVVDGNGSGDTFNVNLTAASAGLTALSIVGSAVVDNLNVLATPTGVATTYQGTNAEDQVSITNAGSLLGILGSVHLQNAAGFSDITINATADAVAHTVAISVGSITGLAPAAITYGIADVDDTTISTGALIDTFNVTGNNGSNTVAVINTINAGGGNDIFNIAASALNEGINGTNNFNGEGGDDTFNTTGFPTIATQVVNIDGGAHAVGDTLNVDANGANVVATPTTITNGGTGVIGYVNIEDINLTDLNTLTMNGTAGNDVLTLTRTAANQYRAAGAGYGTPIDFESPAIASPANQFTFNGLAGDDTLTVNNSAFSASVNLRVGYDGGTQSGSGGDAVGPPGDSLVITGQETDAGIIARTTYLVGNTQDAGSWILDPDGSRGPGAGAAGNGDELVVNFLGLEPVDDDTPAAIFDVVYDAGDADNITIQNGGLLNAFQSIRVLDNGGTFETFRFANKTTVRLSLNDLADVAVVDYSIPAAGLTTLEVYGHVAPGIVGQPADDNARDYFQLRATAAGPQTSLLGQGGDDIFENLNIGLVTLALAVPGGTFNLSNINGPVSIDGGTHGAAGDFIALSDLNAAAADIGTLTNTTLTGVAPATITYATVESFYLELTALNDTLDITSSQTGTAYTIAGDGGSDTITIGNQTADFSVNANGSLASDGGSLDAILGPIAVIPDSNGAAGANDIVNIDDSGTAALFAAASVNDAGAGVITLPDGETITGSFTTLVGFASAAISYAHTGTGGTFGIGNAANRLEQLNVFTSDGTDTIAVNATTATVTSRIDMHDGNDNSTMTINGDGLSAANIFHGSAGNDQFILNITANIGAAAAFPITDLEIWGDAPAGNSANRDRLIINDNAAAGRFLNYQYLSQTTGDLDIEPIFGGSGLFGPADLSLEIRTMETVVFNAAGNNDFVNVTGTADDDLLTVALRNNNTSALVFLGGAPYLSTPPVTIANSRPGVAGGGFGPDLLINGMLPGSGLFLSGGGNTGTPGDGDRAIVYAASENDLVDVGNATDIFGFGPGILQPGFGANNAYDTINVTDGLVTTTNNAFGPLTPVILNTASFIQAGPAVSTQQSALIVDGGDEASFQANNVADDITVTISTNFNIQANGNLPGLTFANPADKFSERQGDQLTITPPIFGTLNIFSDAATPPNVSVGATNSTFVVRNTSIERLNLDAGLAGNVNLIGDNNDPAVTQNDYFRVRGRDIDGNGEGVNELQLELGGNYNPATGAVSLSPPIFINNVFRLNVSGGEAVGFDAFGNAIPNTVGTGTDALDITAYADNTPRGWGVETYFNEGDDSPTGDGGLQAPDLLIFNGVLGVSENIVIQPSGPLNGQVFSNNAATNTPIAVVNYLLNSHIIVNGSSPAGTAGDTDSLTLRGTDPASPSTSGNENVVADFNAAGTAVTPMVRVYDAGATFSISGRPTAAELADTAGVAANILYNLQDFTNFDTIGFDLLDGSDVISLIGRNDGSLTVDIDGGSDSFADGIVLPGVAGASDRLDYVAGSSSNEASLLARRSVAATFTRANLTNVDNVVYDGGGGAGTDLLQVFGTPGVDNFDAAPTSAIAGLIAVGSFPAITYANLGTATSAINLINQGVPGAGTNLDSASIRGTAAVDAYVWTALTATSGTLGLTTGGVTSLFSLSGFASADLDAAAAADTLTTTVTNAIVDQGPTSGSGTITATDAGGQGLLPLGFRNVESSTINGGTVVINGTEQNDIILLAATGVLTVTNAGGLVLQTYDLAGADRLIINALGGDDQITIAANAPFTGISVLGGDNGTATDELNVDSVGADVTVNTANQTIQQVAGPLVSYDGLENINIDANQNNVTFVGGALDEHYIVTPNVSPVDLTVNTQPGVFFQTDDSGQFTIDPLGGDNSITVRGTEIANGIVVNRGANSFVTVAGRETINMLAANTDHLIVAALGGDDNVLVAGTGGPANLTVDLGGPTASDTLNVSTGVNASVTYGTDPSSGVIGDATNGNVNFFGTEIINLAGAGGGTLTINGTNADDAINQNTNSVTVNNGAVVNFNTYATLTLNGLAGDDKINVHPVGLVGVTTINVAGGDPTASDELVVNGTAGNDTIEYAPTTVGAGSVTITGAPVVNFTGTESAVIDGLGGTDPLTHRTPAGGHFVTYTPGVAADAGTIATRGTGPGTSLVPLTFNHIGAQGNITFRSGAGAGAREDLLELYGTNISETFNVNGAADSIQIVAGLAFVTEVLNTPAILDARLFGLDGDDTFNLSGTLPYAATTVDAGNPSASDIVNLTLPAGAVVVNFASTTTVTGYGGTVSLIGVEVLNADTNTQNLTINATTGNDVLSVTPTGANAATATLVSSDPNIGSTPVVNGSNIGTLTVDLLAGSDRLVVTGTQAGETYTVTGALVTVGALETVNYLGTEDLHVLGQAGNDTFNVTPAATTTIFIDGGDPIGTSPGDLINFIPVAAFQIEPGPESDEGGFVSAGAIQRVSWDHIESLIVQGGGGFAGKVLGTGADDDITIIARDDSTHPALAALTPGVRDFTVQVNAGPQILFIDQATLFIDAGAGDDDIVLRTPAPNLASWDVDVNIAGGTPAAGTGDQGDVFELETPGTQTVVYTPTGIDTALINITTLSSIINIAPFICPVTGLPSSPGGVEEIIYQGLGGGDTFTALGTAVGDSFVYNPALLGSGTHASTGAPALSFFGVTLLNITGGAGGADDLVVNGTQDEDTFTSPITDSIALTGGGQVNIGGGIDQVNLNSLDGNDAITLDLDLNGLKKVIDAGAGDDNVNMSASDDADIFGGIGNDILVGTPLADNIFGGPGNDNINAGAGIDNIYAGSGDDILIGGADADFEYGEEGNDIFQDLLVGGVPSGAADDAGADFLDGGLGSDIFVWEPGDGNDRIEGGSDESDRIIFQGNAAGTAFTFNAGNGNVGGTRLEFLFGAVDLDVAGVEEFDLNTLAGADIVTVNDLAQTDIRFIDIDLLTAAGDADTVTVNGRAVSDQVDIAPLPAPNAAIVAITGLAYDIRITGLTAVAGAGGDVLTFNGNAGNDTVVSNDALNTLYAPEDVIVNGGDGDDFITGFGTLNGGLGNDTLLGGAFVNLINGGDGEDFISGGGGIDDLNGDAGEDTFLANFDGVIDNIDGGTEFDTILIQATSGNDRIDFLQFDSGEIRFNVLGLGGGTGIVGGAGTQTDDIVPQTVEEVEIVAGSGDDIIRVAHADSLILAGVALDMLRITVNGGAPGASDRLTVTDLGDGDTTIHRIGGTAGDGSFQMNPVANLPIVAYTGIEFASLNPIDPVTGGTGTDALGRLFVFKFDPFEENSDRLNATFLGSNEATNVDPVIDPGPDVDFGLPGDEDWYRIVAQYTGDLDVRAFFRHQGPLGNGRNGLPGAGDLDIRAYDNDGTLIATSNSVDDDERIRIPAVEGQTYYIRVQGFIDAINVYNLSAINLPAEVPIDLELADNLVILNEAQEVPAPATPAGANGTANFQYNAALNTFDLDLFVSGIETAPFTSAQPDVTQAHIHVGAPGVAGPVVVDLLALGATFTPEPGGIRLRLANAPYSAVAGNITALLTGNAYINVHTAQSATGQVRGQISIEQVYGSSDSGRSQFDNYTTDETPTIFIRVPDVVNIGGVANLDDVPHNGQAPGGPPTNDPSIFIPFVPATTLDVPGITNGFRVPVFITERGTTDQGPPNNVLAGYAQPVDPVNRPGLFVFTFSTALANLAIAPDGSYFIRAKVEMIDPAQPDQAQGYGEFSESMELLMDNEQPPVFFGFQESDTDGLHPDSDTGSPVFPLTLTDNITSDTTPTFWGTAEADSVVRVYVETNGIAGLQTTGQWELQDKLIGQTTANPLDGTNAFPNGRWEITSAINMNDPEFFPVQDGIRTIYVTAEDVPGNLNSNNLLFVEQLQIFVDTQGPQITDVDINSAGNVYDLFDPKPSTDGPTPNVNSLVISVMDLPLRLFPFLYQAILGDDPGTAAFDHASNPGNYLVKGDYNGIIPIQRVDVVSPVPPGPGPVLATATITLHFRLPGPDGVFDTSDDIGKSLPDDRFTFTINDEGVIDPAGNILDGETNAAQPLEGVPPATNMPILGVDFLPVNVPGARPSGDNRVGGDFIGRFTIDTRPELAVWAGGSIWVDANGNNTYDSDALDFSNRDFAFVFGFATDEVFAGKFMSVNNPADRNVLFDKTAAYGRVGTDRFRWLVDTDNDGVPNIEVEDPADIVGHPVAGNFGAFAGDEVGLFTGSAWFFDTNHNFNVELGNSIAWPAEARGRGVVGDFDGDGFDDLASWADDFFHVDLSSKGAPGPVAALNNAALGTGVNGTIDATFRFGFPGVAERPVAADMNMDGIEDLGLWVPPRDGVTPVEEAEWYFLVSGLTANNTGGPGNPTIGFNIGPTITGSGDAGPGSYLANNTASYLAGGQAAVDYLRGRVVLDPLFPGSGLPSPNIIRYDPTPFGNDLYMQFGDEFALPLLGNFDPPVSGGTGNGNVATNPRHALDVNNDGYVTPLDALLVINHMNLSNGTTAVPTSGFLSAPFLDVNGDDYVSPSDALDIINFMNSPSEGEGEAADAYFNELGEGESSDDDFLGLFAADQGKKKK